MVGSTEIVLTAGTWIAAFAPVGVLLVLVTSGWVTARSAALVVAVLSLVLAFAVFGAGPEVLGVALAKGLWLGCWILAVVWPAMLLYQLASRAGLDRIGVLLSALFPNPREKLLVLAWLLPSFVQGVAGFGTPIAVAAPLLVAAGWSKVRAVIYPLIGYHWSVTFGSMGSSFYIAALTAHLGEEATASFARNAAFLLGANSLVAGAVVLVLEGGLRGLRGGARMLLVAGPPMAATLYFVAPVVPAIGSVAAGAVGLVAAFTVAAADRLRRGVRRDTPASAGVGAAATPTDQAAAAGAPAASGAAETRTPGSGATVSGDAPGSGGGRHPPRNGRRAAWVVVPYFYLVGAALAALLVPASRRWISSHAVVGPRLPGTTTALGVRNAPVTSYTPLEVFGHPGTYLLFACAAGYVTYRLAGLWPGPGARRLGSDWLGSVKSSSISIVALACVATVLRDSGMMITLARGLVAVAGDTYPYVAALVGAVGCFLTGSSTSANALFGVLQADVAKLVGVPPPVLLAAQAAGANVGNSVAPVVVLIGLSAVDGQRKLARVIRVVAMVALVLLAVVTGLTVLLLATDFLPS